MFKKTSIFLLILIMAFSVFAVGCGSDDSDSDGAKEDTSLADIQEKGELVLGCDDEFPPMGFVEDGEVVGFDIDLARAVCEKLGVELKAQPINWDSKEMELESGNIDVIWNGYSIDAERNEKVEFTKPYLQNQQLLVVKKDSKIKDKAGFEGKVLGVQQESAAEKIVNKDTEFVDSLKDTRVYDTYQKAMMDLKDSDRIDGVAGDKILIEYIMQQEPDTFVMLEGSLEDEYFGIGCRKGEFALRDAIDDALDELQEDGTIDKICEKWFSNNIVIRDVDRLTQEELEQ